MSDDRMVRLYADEFIQNQRMFGLRRTFSKNVHGTPYRAGRFFRAPHHTPATDAAREYQLQSHDTRMRFADYGSRPQIGQIDDTLDFTSRRHYGERIHRILHEENPILLEKDTVRNLIDYKIRPKASPLFAPKP